MNTLEPIAHLSEDGRTQPLIAHLTGTAQKVAVFAAQFGCGEWGYLSGLWQDLHYHPRGNQTTQ